MTSNRSRRSKSAWMQNLLEDEEEEDMEDEVQQVQAVVATMLGVGAEEARLRRIQCRNEHRSYLCRPDLLPHPRGDTPWQRLHNGHKDRAYIVTMGLDVPTFELILASGFEQRWNESTIDRTDVSSSGVSRPERRSLDAAGGLGLTLHWLSSTMREITLQQVFALIPATVTCYVTFALRILLETLKSMPLAKINWPDEVKDHNEFEELSKLVLACHHLLLGAFGSIDGLNLLCQESDDIEIENATYNGWLHSHFVSSVLAFRAKGTLIASNWNCPGSWHDSRVTQPIYERLQNCTPEGYFLVADTAFPHGTKQIEGRIRVPIKQGQTLPSDEAELRKDS
ncbi:unnamed protein product [Somion occarium]|uniref:DDE Tnp4 domain-containing protein n=1 Tax=Somion occarium TaxID=3059160 RepID=A0ABP1DX15_9APHY